MVPKPIAESVGLGLVEWLEHADPVETQSSGNRLRIICALALGKVTFKVFGKRAACSPLTFKPGIPASSKLCI